MLNILKPSTLLPNNFPNFQNHIRERLGRNPSARTDMTYSREFIPFWCGINLESPIRTGNNPRLAYPRPCVRGKLNATVVFKSIVGNFYEKYNVIRLRKLSYVKVLPPLHQLNVGLDFVVMVQPHRIAYAYNDLIL